MIRVVLSGAMREAAGQERIALEAHDVRTLFARLQERHPALEPFFERGVAVSIDGTIYRDALLRKLEPETEVFLLPRLPGG